MLEEGWTELESEPGVFHKVRKDGTQLWATIYVDDTLITGESESAVDEEMAAILKRFSGAQVASKGVKVKIDGKSHDALEMDVLGCTITYCREQGYLHWGMRDAIHRLCTANGFPPLE